MPEIKNPEFKTFYYDNFFQCIKDFPEDKKMCHQQLILEMTIVNRALEQNAKQK
jgi:hypothetical protein